MRHASSSMPRLLGCLVVWFGVDAGTAMPDGDALQGASADTGKDFPAQLHNISRHFDSTTSNADLEVFAARLPSQLQHLSLAFGGNPAVGNSGLEALATHLPSQLHHLSLDFTYSDVGNSGLEALATHLPSQLHHLSLALRGNPAVGNSGLEALATHLPSQLHHVSLDFSVTAVGNAGVEALARHLPSQLQFLSLDFSYNSAVGNAGVEALARHLPSHLQQLSLSFSDTSLGTARLPFSLLQRRAFNKVVFILPGGEQYHSDGPLDTSANLLVLARHFEMSDPEECGTGFSTADIDLLSRDASYRTAKMFADANRAENLSKCLASLGGEYSPLRDAHALGAIALALVVAAVYTGVTTSVKSSGVPTGSRLYRGERLLAARALSSRGRLGKAGPLLGKLGRAFQVCARWAFVAGPFAYLWSPFVVAGLVLLVYAAAAAWRHGLRATARNPFLVFFSTYSALQSFVLLALSLGMFSVWLRYGECTGVCHVIASLRNKRTMDLPICKQFWATDTLRAPLFNTNIAVLDLYDILWGFICIVLVCFFLDFVFSTIRAVLRCALSCCCGVQTSKALDESAVQELVRQIRQKVTDGDFLRAPPQGVEPVRAWPTSLFSPGLYFALFLLSLDMIWGDLNTIWIMLCAGHYLFASCLTTIFATTIFSDIATGNFKALPGEIRETLSTGVYTPRLLEVIERERGFEAFLSLGITAYAVPFAFTNARSMVTGFLSMCLSIWGLGTHVYESLDLGMLETDDSAEPEGERADEEAATAASMTQDAGRGLLLPLHAE